MPVFPIAVVEVTVAGARVPGRNRQIIVCRLKQNGNTTQGWDTIRPKQVTKLGAQPSLRAMAHTRNGAIVTITVMLVSLQ